MSSVTHVLILHVHPTNKKSGLRNSARALGVGALPTIYHVLTARYSKMLAYCTPPNFVHPPIAIARALTALTALSLLSPFQHINLRVHSNFHAVEAHATSNDPKSPARDAPSQLLYKHLDPILAVHPPSVLLCASETRMDLTSPRIPCQPSGGPRPFWWVLSGMLAQLPFAREFPVKKYVEHTLTHGVALRHEIFSMVDFS
jgi:hypothetical protein